MPIIAISVGAAADQHDDHKENDCGDDASLDVGGHGLKPPS